LRIDPNGRMIVFCEDRDLGLYAKMLARVSAVYLGNQEAGDPLDYALHEAALALRFSRARCDWRKPVHPPGRAKSDRYGRIGGPAAMAGNSTVRVSYGSAISAHAFLCCTPHAGRRAAAFRWRPSDVTQHRGGLGLVRNESYPDRSSPMVGSGRRPRRERAHHDCRLPVASGLSENPKISQGEEGARSR